ncbi:hypothetical protein [Parasphingorhabdus sp.]|uniref:hypothetical protein n=1 Tax=Parasphingorhabdus sp. TaxID=2709688 RepID=UPI0035939454
MLERLRGEIDLISTSVAAGFITLLITIISLILSAVSSSLKWYWLVAGSALVVLCLLAIAGLVIGYLSKPVTKKMDDLVERLVCEHVIKEAPWLITSQRLRKIEAASTASRIWIITRSMEEELDPDLFGDVVKGNIARGIKYTYVVPDIPPILARVERVKDLYQSDQIDFLAINDPLFDLISAQDMAIFGALGAGSKEMAGYMNLPIQEGGNDYFMVLNSRHCELIVGTLSSIPSRNL